MPATTVDEIRAILKARDPHHPEFIQAVEEVLDTLKPLFEREPKYIPVFERMLEPERTVIFRVPWTDDAGKIQVNRGFRVQYSSVLGPYKGGLRFHPTVNLSILKFLGFEQILKNSLTTLPMGGGKGGSDFDPKGKSDNEVMRFCQSFMTELHRHIGADTDVPAGDIGVGAREIGYLFGQYKRLANSFNGVLTGKNYAWGGSLIRPEATGYGAVYFLDEMCKDNGEAIRGKTVLLSGSGNVAQFACQKLNEFGARVISFSDSNGTVIDEDGITPEKLAHVMHIKNELRGRIREYVDKYPSAKYYDGQTPWQCYGGHVDCIIPSATQNEVHEADVTKLVSQGLKFVVEGANMPSDAGAVHAYHENKVMFGPAKATNAGGVAVSGLEMSQNSMRMQWTREEVDRKLKDIMSGIFRACRDTAKKYGFPKNYQLGANIAGFIKVADAMIDQGCV
ncbi:NADP-specific glutamate dehydrogenase [Giardia muris]|uniref:Glutamate dehydrogenase n=1 Tax=Giardia muris TaxID=5742 RepID=A0A4Z1T1F4_GIAMU|nr:NADP-specific glutamate dehydrogenase [Giardia muris]|eukprot:TNJ26369.1 NADP-specific glutamate dehydrogenase [Giardia muris]